MEKLKMYQVDAFTDKIFGGNPAAVCVLEDWLPDELMQSIAAENNLSETAFVVPKGNEFEIRWFSPPVEVDLCGHATLASAFVLYELLNYQQDEILFKSRKSGYLKVVKENELLVLDFPADELKPQDALPEMVKGLGIEPKEVYKGRFDYLAILNTEEDIQNLQPDFTALTQLASRGIIVSAPGNEMDFVSRFFAPQTGIPEDPVTGSAHTSLIPYWAGRLGKKELRARQISSRIGDLWCQHLGERVKIGGKARLYMVAEILTQ
jgi:PhzF family phenazine biosynthesis protein